MSTVLVGIVAVGIVAVAAPVAGTVPAGVADDSSTVAPTSAENGSTPDGFTAYGQNGAITLGGQQDDPIVLPKCNGTTPQEPEDDSIEWEDECFTISASEFEVGENGTQATWSVSSDNVTFPQIKTTDVSADYANISLSAPNGFNGTVDLQTGTVNITGTFNILIEVRGSILGDADCQTQTTLDMTTGTGNQGILEGEPLSINETTGTGTATVVADAFPVPEFETTSGNSLICSTAQDRYNLPAEEPGDNTFQFELLVQLDQ